MNKFIVILANKVQQKSLVGGGGGYLKVQWSKRQGSNPNPFIYHF